MRGTAKSEDYLNGYSAGYSAGKMKMIKEARKKGVTDISRINPLTFAHWVAEGDGYADGEMVYDMWFCSACGYRVEEYDDVPPWKFCPMCGARMVEDKGEKNEVN